MKKLLDRIFIDGLGGMAQGLFATLIIGTIIQQIGLFMGGGTGDLIYELGKIAAGLTGAGIGVGVARKLEAGHLVIVSAAVVGMIGAFAGKILSGQVLVDGVDVKDYDLKDLRARVGVVPQKAVLCGGVSGDRDRDLDLG